MRAVWVFLCLVAVAPFASADSHAGIFLRAPDPERPVECRYEIVGLALDLSHVDPIYAECMLAGGPVVGASLTP